MAEAAAGFWDDAEIIHTYTRADALRDGVLYDVSDLAKEAGFVIPIAVTAGVMAAVDANKGPGESEKGRLWDILNVLRFRIRCRRDHGQRIDFRVKIRGRVEYLYSIVGPGDDFEPVLTILMIGED